LGIDKLSGRDNFEMTRKADREHLQNEMKQWMNTSPAFKPGGGGWNSDQNVHQMNSLPPEARTDLSAFPQDDVWDHEGYTGNGPYDADAASNFYDHYHHTGSGGNESISRQHPGPFWPSMNDAYMNFVNIGNGSGDRGNAVDWNDDEGQSTSQRYPWMRTLSEDPQFRQLLKQKLTEKGYQF
jgi:hypothetical protein